MTQTKGFQTFVLALLILAGLLSLFMADSAGAVLLLMALAYASNASYSMVSRSGVRDSVAYHAFTTLISNFIFYLVVRNLITSNMTMALFIPYTVATVFGSLTGSRASQWVEERFGITVDSSKTKESKESKLARYLLLTLLGVMGIIIAVYSPTSWMTVVIAGLAFGDNITFSILRRSRNTSNTTYHVFAALLKSLAWYLLFQSLSLRGMALELFVPYCFGSILGGISGQKISSFVEKKIGATADAHLSADVAWYRLIPWKLVSLLTVLTVATAFFFGGSRILLILAVLSGSQQLVFSMVSRARQRNNVLYHTISSIFSNAVWFLTFRQLQVEKWTPELYIPYALGGTAGSVTGVGVSMGIEKALHIESDSKKK